MDVKLQIVYEDPKKNKIITVQVKGLGDLSIDRAVDKALLNDSDWLKWNLIDIKD